MMLQQLEKEKSELDWLISNDPIVRDITTNRGLTIRFKRECEKWHKQLVSDQTKEESKDSTEENEEFLAQKDWKEELNKIEESSRHKIVERIRSIGLSFTIEYLSAAAIWTKYENIVNSPNHQNQHNDNDQVKLGLSSEEEADIVKESKLEFESVCRPTNTEVLAAFILQSKMLEKTIKDYRSRDQKKEGHVVKSFCTITFDTLSNFRFWPLATNKTNQSQEVFNEKGKLDERDPLLSKCSSKDKMRKTHQSSETTKKVQ